VLNHFNKDDGLAEDDLPALLCAPRSQSTVLDTSREIVACVSRDWSESNMNALKTVKLGSCISSGRRVTAKARESKGNVEASCSLLLTFPEHASESVLSSCSTWRFGLDGGVNTSMPGGVVACDDGRVSCQTRQLPGNTTTN
jgi:hypothetical protein